MDSLQPITSTLTTEAFGNTVAQWGSSANPYCLAGAWGYRDDGDAGLLYIGARYYEPAVGRWTSADKWVGDIYRPLSLNRYLYCEDEPVNAVDPSGYAKLREIINALLAAITMIYPGFIQARRCPRKVHDPDYHRPGLQQLLRLHLGGGRRCHRLVSDRLTEVEEQAVLAR